MVHPTARTNKQATRYQRDCKAWKEILGELSSYGSQITNAATGPRNLVTRFKKTERWARVAQVFSSLEPMVATELSGPGPRAPTTRLRLYALAFPSSVDPLRR